MVEKNASTIKSFTDNTHDLFSFRNHAIVRTSFQKSIVCSCLFVESKTRGEIYPLS